MKTSPRPIPSARGTTLLELLFVVLIIAIMALLILPVIARAKARAKRAACVSNLHQLGIASHVFAHDHGDQFPFQVSTNDGGTLEFTRAGFAMSGEFYFAFRHFQALSNTLDTTRLVVCPADNRTNASYFSELRNHNLSYFVGVNADYTRPGSILAGDRNITSDSVASGSILRVNPSAPPEWTSGCHEYYGNLLFADGHVEQSSNEDLSSAVQNAGPQISHLLTPVTPPGGGDGSVVSQPTVAATLQRFFNTAPATDDGAAGNSAPAPVPNATLTQTPNATPAPTAKVPEPRPADVPKPAPAPPAMVVKRPAAGPEAGIATNPAPAIAAKSPTQQVAQAGAPGALPSGKPAAGPSTTTEFNFYFLLFQPGRHFWTWLLLLLLTLVAAFLLGWHLHRSRLKRRITAASPARKLA